MTESTTGKTSDLEPIEQRIVKLGEEFQPLIPPLKRWSGYSSHLTSNPSFVSEWVLQTDFLPDLPFLAIIQPSAPRQSTGRFSVEANKDHLGKLGMFDRTPKGPDVLPLLPMQPAVFGAERWAGYYIFDKEVLESFSRLRLQIVIPEGEYASTPNTYKERRTGVKYATGIQFDSFVKTDQDLTESYEVTFDPKDIGALSAVKAKLITV